MISWLHFSKQQVKKDFEILILFWTDLRGSKQDAEFRVKLKILECMKFKEISYCSKKF